MTTGPAPPAWTPHKRGCCAAGAPPPRPAPPPAASRPAARAAARSRGWPPRPACHASGSSPSMWAGVGIRVAKETVLTAVWQAAHRRACASAGSVPGGHPGPPMRVRRPGYYSRQVACSAPHVNGPSAMWEGLGPYLCGAGTAEHAGSCHLIPSSSRQMQQQPRPALTLHTWTTAPHRVPSKRTPKTKTITL